MNRRDFFKIVATTGATAAAAGCQQATEQILPLVVPNEQLVPGVASWFATVCRECPAGCGVLARNRDGRVVKLEGNPDHPVSRGALCARGQAALQGLYHPDRFAGPQRREGDAFKPLSWDDALKLFGDKLGAVRAKKQALAVVSQLESGSLGTLLDRFSQALGGRPRVALEPFGYEAIRAANRLTFGRDAVPYHAFEDAEVILSFGADLLETWVSNVQSARGYARMHAFREGKAGTFIHVEPRQSLTASNADEWVRNAPGTEAAVALAVLRLMVEGGLVADKRYGEAVAGVDPRKVAEESGVPLETLQHVARTFAEARPGLAVGGGVAVTGSQATALQVAVNLLNAAAGNLGKTVRFGPDHAYGRVTRYSEVVKLVQAMAAGEIEVLVLGTAVNPAFTLPGGLKVAEAIRKVPFVVSFANLPDETTALAHLVLPDTHWLESWGDYAPQRGRARPDAAHHEADPRRPADGRRAARGGPRRPRQRGGQGAAAVDDLRAVPEGDLGAGSEGTVGGRVAAGRCLARHPGGRGGGDAEARAGRGGDGQARWPRRRPRAAALSLAALLRRPRRHPGLAAGSPRSDHAGGLGRLGRDQHRDRGPAGHPPG